MIHFPSPRSPRLRVRLPTLRRILSHTAIRDAAPESLFLGRQSTATVDSWKLIDRFMSWSWVPGLAG